MKQLIEQILQIYFKNMREPTLDELANIKENLLDQTGCTFVTLYVNGEIHGSAGNIKEIGTSLAEEILKNTISAITDSRFAPLTLEESEKLQFRVDKIVDRKMIDIKELKKLDPITQGVIVIKRDYEKLAVILPNMSPKILTGDDFIPVLQKKLSEMNFKSDEYILYKITTESETNY